MYSMHIMQNMHTTRLLPSSLVALIKDVRTEYDTTRTLVRGLLRARS